MPGIQLVMYAYCAGYLWKQRATRRHAYFILAYITVIFIIETVFVAVQARTVQICYIDNRVSVSVCSVLYGSVGYLPVCVCQNYPGGPWQYFLATQNLPVNVMFYATLFLITFLCDCLVVSIWNMRLHSIWYSRTFTAVALLDYLDGLWSARGIHRGHLPRAHGPRFLR